MYSTSGLRYVSTVKTVVQSALSMWRVIVIKPTHSPNRRWLCALTTTQAIILPIKYLNSIYLGEAQWHERNKSCIGFSAEVLTHRNKKNIRFSFKGSQRSLIAVASGWEWKEIR